MGRKRQLVRKIHVWREGAWVCGCAVCQPWVAQPCHLGSLLRSTFRIWKILRIVQKIGCLNPSESGVFVECAVNDGSTDSSAGSETKRTAGLIDE